MVHLQTNYTSMPSSNHIVDIQYENRVIQNIAKGYNQATTIKDRLDAVIEFFHYFARKTYLLYEMPNMREIVRNKISEYSRRYELYSYYIDAVITLNDPRIIRSEYEWDSLSTRGLTIEEKRDLKKDFITLNVYMTIVENTLQTIE